MRLLSGDLDLVIARRFWEKVDQKGDGCWLWQGSVFQGTGYGRMKIHQKTYRSHRLAWVLTNGSIPDGLYVCHRCDVPLCCRPDHLFLGTPAENYADMVAKGRRAEFVAGEGHGKHRLTASDVLDIRQSYEAGGISMRKLGAMYGVHLATIHLIITRRNWAHLEEARTA